MTLTAENPETLQFHCEHCHHPLFVPKSAIGHQARCPACRKAFVVPDSDASFEDSVSSWIEQDVHELWEDDFEQQEYEIHSAMRERSDEPEPKSECGSGSGNDARPLPERPFSPIDNRPSNSPEPRAEHTPAQPPTPPLHDWPCSRHNRFIDLF